MSESKPAKPDVKNSDGAKGVKPPTGPAAHTTPGTPADAGLFELATLARQAFEEKRRKHCLALTSAILKIDPEYKEALVIQSWVRSDLERELETARYLVEEARVQSNRELYSRPETMVRKVLNLDPGNEDARKLLLEIVAEQAAAPAIAATPEERPAPAPSYTLALPAARAETPSRLQTLGLIVLLTVVVLAAAYQLLDRGAATDNEAGDVASQDGGASTGSVSANGAASGNGLFQLTVSPAEGVQMMLDGGPLSPVRPEIEVQPGSHILYFWAPGYAPEVVSADLTAGERRNLNVSLKPRAGSKTAPEPAARRSAPPPIEVSTPAINAASRPFSGSRTGLGSSSPLNVPAAAKAEPSNTPFPPADVAPEPPARGTLAVSAPIPIDIYMGERLLGTTPVTLELPPGSQVLEYRYKDLRKTVSYEIKSNETAKAAVSFDLSLQINARPWAQVSIEGVQGRPLGQTPLGNVIVPIGSVLSFRHPNFPEKTYKVRGDEAAIQVTFP